MHTIRMGRTSAFMSGNLTECDAVDRLMGICQIFLFSCPVWKLLYNYAE